MLTQKQEAFTLGLFKGESEIDSWRNAGYSTNYSTDAVYVNASRLAHSTKVKLRLAELRDAAASPLIMSETKRKELLSAQAERPITTMGTGKERVLAIKELNLMEKVYEAPRDPGTTVIQNFLFVLPDGTKVSPKELRETK